MTKPRTTIDYEAAWKGLRRQMKREQKAWAPVSDTGKNSEARTVGAALTGAYGGVLRMMDSLEKTKTVELND